MAFLKDPMDYLDSNTCTEERIRDLARCYLLQIPPAGTRDRLMRELINGFIRRAVKLHLPAAAAADEQRREMESVRVADYADVFQHHLRIISEDPTPRQLDGEADRVKRFKAGTLSLEEFLRDPMSHVNSFKGPHLKEMAKYFRISIYERDPVEVQRNQLINGFIKRAVELYLPAAAVVDPQTQEAAIAAAERAARAAEARAAEEERAAADAGVKAEREPPDEVALALGGLRVADAQSAPPPASD